MNTEGHQASSPDGPQRSSDSNQFSPESCGCTIDRKYWNGLRRRRLFADATIAIAQSVNSQSMNVINSAVPIASTRISSHTRRGAHACLSRNQRSNRSTWFPPLGRSRPPEHEYNQRDDENNYRDRRPALQRRKDKTDLHLASLSRKPTKVGKLTMGSLRYRQRRQPSSEPQRLEPSSSHRICPIAANLAASNTF